MGIEPTTLADQMTLQPNELPNQGLLYGICKIIVWVNNFKLQRETVPTYKNQSTLEWKACHTNFRRTCICVHVRRTCICVHARSPSAGASPPRSRFSHQVTRNVGQQGMKGSLLTGPPERFPSPLERGTRQGLDFLPLGITLSLPVPPLPAPESWHSTPILGPGWEAAWEASWESESGKKKKEKGKKKKKTPGFQIN